MGISVIPAVAGDSNLDIASDNSPGRGHVNKFGLSVNVDSGIDTDIWDRANPSNDQDIWIAPTQARTHQIVSNQAADDGSPGGEGARTLRISGLTDWDTAEVSEDIIMNGTTNVPTVNQYVIIHRMEILTKGVTSTNVGVITATADTDGTITAQINEARGQTLMAIYGIPSTQTAYMTNFYAGFTKAGGGAGAVDISVLYNPEPDVELLNFLIKHAEVSISAGSSISQHFFIPYKKFVGPGIIKMQGNGSANNLTMSSGFDLIIVDN